MSELDVKAIHIVEEAKFLLDRIDEVDWSLIEHSGGFFRDWDGHVEPSISRLKMAIKSYEASLK